MGRAGSRKSEVTYSRRQIQHIGAARRAEVFLPQIEIAGEIVFEIRMVASQTILSDLAGLGVEIRDDDASVVPAFSADDFSTR